MGWGGVEWWLFCSVSLVGVGMRHYMPQSEPWAWPISPPLRSSVPREGLGSSIIALNDQLLWYLPRMHMCPEAGLRQVWHMPSLDLVSLCSYLTIKVSFYPKGLLWGPCFIPCPWAWFGDILAHWEVLLKSRDPMQTSLLLLGILHTKGAWSPYGLFYRQWALANISVTYKSHSNDSKEQGKSSKLTPCVAYLLTKEVEFTFSHLKKTKNKTRQKSGYTIN